MGIEALSDSELLARIAQIWVRDRSYSERSTSMSASLRELLDEVVRRRAEPGCAPRPPLDTPTETPASRRSSKPPR